MGAVGMRKYGAVVVCCRNQLQKEIHEDYLAELEDAHSGLAKKMRKEIFDNVIALYAKVTIPMRNENWRELEQPMDPNNPFAVCTKRQENARASPPMPRNPSERPP